MNAASLKGLLDACFLAKRIVETLPELPKHMKPRHIHVMNVIREKHLQQGMCRVSDVSNALSITTPSVTCLVRELAQMEMVQKLPDKEDGRITLLTLTEKGTECVQRYVVQLQSRWADTLKNITDEQASEAIRIIEELWKTMPRHLDVPDAL